MRLKKSRWNALSRSSRSTAGISKDRCTQSFQIFSDNLLKVFENWIVFYDVEVLSDDFTLGGI